MDTKDRKDTTQEIDANKERDTNKETDDITIENFGNKYVDLSMKRISNMTSLSISEGAIFFGKYKAFRKNLRDMLVDYLENMVKLSGLSNKSAGFIIRAAHFFSPLGLIYSVIFHHRYIAYISIVASFLACSLFVLFGGCFLSKLEQRLCGDDLIITDPFIELLGDEVNTKNRITYTIFIMSIFVCIYVCALFMRFFVKKY
jgi:hypothetical protein